MAPLVSVIMPVYNCEQYVKQAMDSIFAQSFKDFEFIIIDDASNDRTGDIVRGYRDSRIAYVCNEENISITKSLNRAVALSHGEYIVRMDGDDICLPDRLLLQVQFMERNREVAALGSWIQLIGRYNNYKGELRYPIAPNFVRLLCSNLLNWPCLAHPTTIIRKEALKNIGMYNEKYFVCEDYDLWLRLARSYSLRNLPRILLKYRLHRHSSSWKYKELMKKEKSDIILSYIKLYTGSLNIQDTDVLSNILLGNRQENKNRGDRAVEILDIFFQALAADAKDGKRGIMPRNDSYFKELVILFYLPRFALTNLVMAAKIFFKKLPQYHKWVLSVRYLKAIRRIFINN